MNFLKKVFSYAIGNGLSKFIAVIILPIYTNYLNPQEYGRADLAYYTVSIIVSFVFMECWTALLRFIYDDYTEKNRKKVFSNILFLTLLLFIPYILIQYIITIFIASEYVWITCIYGIFYMILQVLQMYTRAIKKSNHFVVSGIISSLIQLVIAYIFTIKIKIGASIIIVAPIIGSIIACLYLIVATKCWKDISFKDIDKKLLKKMCIFCIPLAFNSIAFWAMNNINRYFAAYFLGYDASSYVSIASKLTMIITLAASVYSLAWQENAFENSNNKDKNSVYSKMFSLYLAIFSSATACAIIFVKLIFPIIIGQEYSQAQSILPMYFIAVYFSGVSSFLGQIFGAEKKTMILLTSTIVGTIVNVVTVMLFINNIGIMIIPLGSMLGYLTCTIMRYVNLHKTINVKFNKKDVIMAIILIVISVIMFNLQNSLLLFILFIGILTFMIILFYKEIIKEVLNKVLKRRKNV